MNVLILTDFSEVSKNAGFYAVDFLKNTGANFHLLNIREFNFQKSASDTWNTQLVSTLEKLQQSVQKLEAYTANEEHHFHTRLSSDNLIKAVRIALIEKKIDLIFIGAVSHSEHSHPILGDHAYDVVRKIKCNIMVIPGDCSYRPTEKVVFPLDHSLTSENINKISDRLDYFEPSEFKLLGISETEVSAAKEKIESENDMEYLPTFNSDIFRKIQKDFDLVFVLGKNLTICDRLLHKDYGISSAMNMEIPIFVYHG